MAPIKLADALAKVDVLNQALGGLPPVSGFVPNAGISAAAAGQTYQVPVSAAMRAHVLDASGKPAANRRLTASSAKGPIALPELLADPDGRALGELAQPCLLDQALDVAVGEPAHVGADDERLQGPGPDHRPDVGQDLADEAVGGVAELRHLDLELAPCGLHPPRAQPVAGTPRLRRPLIASPTEKLGHLLLEAVTVMATPARFGGGMPLPEVLALLLFVVAVALAAGAALFNWPQFLVFPHLRSHSGLLRERPTR